MNIFIIENCPKKSANYLPDQLLIKMPTESSQMLACAAIRHGVPERKMPLTKAGTPAKGGYHYHPCSKWAGQTRSNFLWLCEHGLELCKTYTKAYGKIHFCEKGIGQYIELQKYIPDGPLTPFVVAIKDDKKCRTVVSNFDHLDILAKYRLYFKHDKKYATWNKLGNRPHWMDLPDDKIITLVR